MSFNIIISIQRIDTTKESDPMVMEFGGMVDIVQRFVMLVRSAVTDKKDLFMIPTDYYKRETDAVAYIVGSDHSVYKLSIYEKKYDGHPTVYKKVCLKDTVDEYNFATYIYKMSYALAHSFAPKAFSTIPNKKQCKCNHDHDHHCNCNHDYDYDKQEVPSVQQLHKPFTSSGDIIKHITDRQEIEAIMEEDAECDSKFRPPFLKK